MELQDKSSAKKNKGMFLAWEDLTVLAQNLRNGATRKLLNGISGYAEPNRMMAIMGPSGSGKSTLIDALAGRLSRNVTMTGNVLLNGRKGAIDCRDVAYVTQDDRFLGTLSVRETLTYSAHLRLPTETTINEINEVVEETLMKMGLQDCADSKIGNWHLRGLSTGEKRRLSISIDILTQPKVLFLDEPTSGLDSASAFFVLQVLSNMAHDGRIVICSIHQPNSHLFDLFDDLLLLTSGETIYFGNAKLAVKFFAEAGFPCPTRRNPADHFLRCINSDFDKIVARPMQSQRQCVMPMSSDSQINLSTKEIKARLLERYRNSENSINIRKRVRELALKEQVDIVSNKSRANWWKQLRILSRRSFVNMCRDMGYYWLRILFYVLISLALGIMFFNIGLSHSAIVARAKLNAFICGFMLCLSVGGLPFFIEEYKVSQHERVSGHYGEAVFVVANFLSSFPFGVILSLCSGTIIYYMVKFHPGFSHYAYFCLNLLLSVSIVEICMMVVALWVPNFLMGMGVGTLLVVLMMMASAMSRTTSDLPKVFWTYPMSYMSFASWAIEGQYKNDMMGLVFDPLVPRDAKLTGEEILQKQYGIHIDHSKWLDLVALLCLLILYRLLFFAVLKYKETLLSILHRAFAKITFHPPLVKQAL